MTYLRILHVDDDPDIRAVVELSLGLDPAFSVRSCASGQDALATAVDWSPDMILCDVMMPVMDGPATLTRLRECPQTVNTPVVFMTARAQTRELEHFKSLGAAGVIPKPFDPITLVDSVRCHLRSAGLAGLRGRFVKRMRADAATLAEYRAGLSDETSSSRTLEQIKSFAHALVGSGGIFGFHDVSNAASALERTAIDHLGGNRTPGEVEGELDALLACIEHS
jgi:CheY-like chemotaxis protein/HPt (histidine-containing phosphotransfer) domain-containing protein